MRVLCLNMGSSSFKWSALEMPKEDLLAHGEEQLGSGQAAPVELAAIRAKTGPVQAVAHRFVHGGGRFSGATVIDAAVLKSLEAIQSLDPTHTPRALAGVAAAREAFPNVPQVACFDTAFHASLAPAAYTYAIPGQWSAWGLRRYGFHGLSVAYAVRRAAEMMGQGAARLLVCHLGSGSSITAVRDNHSVDTTMGFTPLEGLPMATRSGSVDPGLLLYVMRERGLSAAEVERALEQESGLRGLAETGDLREVLRRAEAAADPDAEEARAAYAVWLAGVRRGLGAMLAALDGLEAVIFTGGIGEHSPRVRADVLLPFAWCGLAVDATANREAEGDARLSASSQKIAVLAIEAREDVTMARETVARLR